MMRTLAMLALGLFIAFGISGCLGRGHHPGHGHHGKKGSVDVKINPGGGKIKFK